MDNDLLGDAITGFIGPSVHPNESTIPSDSGESRQTPPSHILAGQSSLVEQVKIQGTLGILGAECVGETINIH